MKRFSILLWLIGATFVSSHGQQPSPASTKQALTQSNIQLPEPRGFVNDFENILTQTEEAKLTALIEDFKKKTSNEIAIATVDTLLNFPDIQPYATALGNKWGVGLKDKNNGLTIVVSKKLRKIGIATGLGTEKILTDEFCKKTINEQMIPSFKQGNYYQGLTQGLQALIAKWK